MQACLGAPHPKGGEFGGGGVERGGGTRRGQVVEVLISQCNDFGFYLESQGKRWLQYS